MDDGYRTTEFNSSVATLERIDNLLKILHQASVGVFPEKEGSDMSNNNIYIKTLPRLYLEARAKFKPEEKKQCVEDWQKIEQLITDGSKDVYMPFISVEKYGSRDRIPNHRYHKIWRDIKRLAYDFEEKLMDLMDKHGLLMTEKEELDLSEF